MVRIQTTRRHKRQFFHMRKLTLSFYNFFIIKGTSISSLVKPQCVDFFSGIFFDISVPSFKIEFPIEIAI